MSWKDDPTLDPALTSWVEVPAGSDFPIQNLPFGTMQRNDRTAIAVAIGDHVLDLRACQEAGLLGEAQPGTFVLLQALLLTDREVWTTVRRRVSELLSDERNRAAVEPHLSPAEDVQLMVPVHPRDYVDFYSSLEHATNLGRMFRPDAEPLLPNWRHMPIGYHGRSGTVVVSDTDVHRPRGQTKAGDAEAPSFGPTKELDVEVELGFVTGDPTAFGQPIPIDRVRDHVFGVVLVNDWSARDIQRWEYQPLGPFLGKSFATSISPWVVMLDALEPYRVPSPTQDPPPLPHLRIEGDWGYDINLELAIGPGEPQPISRTNARYLYWTIPQQLAHATSNGATVRPGDLFATGTISGPTPGTYGSLIELTWNGERPIALPDGSQRTFLEDGDAAVIRGWCERDGSPRIGLGEVRGTVLPSAG